MAQSTTSKRQVFSGPAPAASLLLPALCAPQSDNTLLDRMVTADARGYVYLDAAATYEPTVIAYNLRFPNLSQVGLGHSHTNSKTPDCKKLLLYFPPPQPLQLIVPQGAAFWMVRNMRRVVPFIFSPSRLRHPILCNDLPCIIT